METKEQHDKTAMTETVEFLNNRIDQISEIMDRDRKTLNAYAVQAMRLKGRVEYYEQVIGIWKLIIMKSNRSVDDLTDLERQIYEFELSDPKND